MRCGFLWWARGSTAHKGEGWAAISSRSLRDDLVIRSKCFSEITFPVRFWGFVRQEHLPSSVWPHRARQKRRSLLMDVRRLAGVLQWRKRSVGSGFRRRSAWPDSPICSAGMKASCSIYNQPADAARSKLWVHDWVPASTVLWGTKQKQCCSEHIGCDF